MKTNSNIISMKKMSDEEFDREMEELKVHVSVLVDLLQEYEEDKRYC